MDNPQALPLGTRLAGEYRIESVLGSGGFGITYLAEEETLKRKVAIKEYFPTGLAGREGSMLVRSKGDKGKGRYIWGLDRFIHEAQILAKFNHDNIVRVFRYFRENNTAYMVLHYEEGQSLKAWLDGLGRAPLQQELDVMLKKLLPALEQLHDTDYLHRDIAPDNILIRADGAPVLIDFGSARGEVAQQSKTVSAIVKPGYSPFEQYAMDGKQQGPWTDIYSLGATLYYAICRRRPLDAPGRITNDQHKSAFEASRGSYRKSFLKAIDQALSVKPDQRPSDINEWRDMLFEGENSQKNSAANAKTDIPGQAANPASPGTQAATRLAGTMPAMPAFLRKRRKVEKTIEIEPIFERPKSDRPTPGDKAASLAKRLAEAKAQANAPQSTKPDHKAGAVHLSNNAYPKTEHAHGGVNNFAYIGVAAAALPEQIDIPLTRLVHAATSAGAGASAYIYGVLRLALTIPYRIVRAAVTTEVKPVPIATPHKGAAVNKRGARPIGKQPAPSIKFPNLIPQFASTRPRLSFLAAATLLLAVSVQQKWLPEYWVSEAQTVFVSLKSNWPQLKNGIEQSYSSTLASVEHVRRALGPDENVPIGKLQIFRGHEGMVQAAIFTPDGKYVISGGIDEHLRLWNVATGKQKKIISKGQGSVTALDIRGDNILAAEANGFVKLKNWRTGETIKTIRHHNGLVWSVAFAKMESSFYTAGQDGKVKYWQKNSSQPEFSVEGNHGAINAIAAFPERDRIAIGGADSNIRLWDMSKNKMIRKYRGHKRAISSIDFSPDGKYIVSAGLDGRLKLWSSTSSRTRRTLHGHKGRIFMAKFSPDGKLIASAGEDGTVRLWNVRRRRLARTFKGHKGAVRSIAFSNNGNNVVSASDDGTVRVWTIRQSNRQSNQKIANRRN